MPQTIEIKIPDIGDFKEVAVIEVLVKPGDVIKAEDSRVTLESDKASRDVPAPSAGMVKAVKVKVGDMVAEGTVVLLLETDATQAVPAPAKPATSAPVATPATSVAAAPTAPVRTPAPAASTFGGDVQDAQVPRAQGRAGAAKVDFECDLLVPCAGPGGYSAASPAADLGLKTAMVERYAVLGGG